MKYWLLRGKKPHGPLEPSELIKESDFAAESMVCPENQSPTKTKHWKVANKVKELKPWLRELAARENATGVPWDADKTRVIGHTPPPVSAMPGLTPILPSDLPARTAEDAADRFKRKADTEGPRMPTFRTTTARPSNFASGLATFSVIVCVGTLAMMLSGRCSGQTPERKFKPHKRYVVPAAP